MKAPVAKKNHLKKSQKSSAKRSTTSDLVKRADLSGCTQSISPGCVSSLYGIPPVGPVHPDNSLGVYEAIDRYSQDALDAFFHNSYPEIPNGTHPIESPVDGALNSTLYEEGESDLDFQLAYPILYPQNITLFQTNEGSSNGFFNVFLDAIDGVSIPLANQWLNNVTNQLSLTALTARTANVVMPQELIPVSQTPPMDLEVN